MEKEKIARINELKRISKERDLTEEEKAEQGALRAEYIAGFRANMQHVLESVRIQEEDGSLTALRRKTDS